MVGHGGSSTGSYLADSTSPIPSHCASIVMTSTLRVNFTYFTWGKPWCICMCVLYPCWGDLIVHDVSPCAMSTAVTFVSVVVHYSRPAPAVISCHVAQLFTLLLWVYCTILLTVNTFAVSGSTWPRG